MKVIQGLYSGVTTVELDTLAAETAATLTTKHPDYALVAARIAVSNLHKESKKVFSGKLRYHWKPLHCTVKLIKSLVLSLYTLSFFVDVMEDLYNYVNPLNKLHSPMISKETLDIVLENKAVSRIWLFLNVCKQSRWRF